MKSLFSILILVFCVSGCDLFSLTDKTDLVTGSWSSNVVPQAGDCCHIELTLDSNKGDVMGTGTVGTPGPRVGSFNQFAIAVTGTIIDERINLSLASDFNPGTIEGVIRRNFNRNIDVVLEVDFSGFGFSGRDIVLFPVVDE